MVREMNCFMTKLTKPNNIQIMFWFISCIVMALWRAIATAVITEIGACNLFTFNGFIQGSAGFNCVSIFRIKTIELCLLFMSSRPSRLKAFASHSILLSYSFSIKNAIFTFRFQNKIRMLLAEFCSSFIMPNSFFFRCHNLHCIIPAEVCQG